MEVLTMDMLMRFPGGKSKAFTMSYDDGTYQDYRLIDIMSKHGLRGTFNINSFYVSESDAQKEDERLSAKQVRELYIPAGHEIALHTYTHSTLVDLPPERVSYEYLKDREILEDMFGIIIRGSAYPNSRYNQKVISCLKACGVAYARGGKETCSFELPSDWLEFMPTVRHTNPQLMEFGRRFVDYNPLSHHPAAMFSLMGHSHEFWRADNWNVIEDFAALIGGRDDIWYATNIEIYDYIEAFNMIRFSLDLKIAHNPTSTDVWICAGGRSYLLKKGETTLL